MAQTGPHIQSETIQAATRISLLLFIALASILFGAKLLLIYKFGSIVPYWDQWDAEAAGLYKPYIDGNLNWETLTWPHNEHRILTMRLFSLLLLELAGGWDPLLQMIASAALHVVGIVLLVRILASLLPEQEHVTYIAFAAALFSFPVGWENTLVGAQAQIYFALLFSILALVLLVPYPAFSPQWFAGVALSVASYFSFASGALTLPAVAAVLLLQIAVGRRARSLGEATSILMVVAVAAVMIAFIPKIPGHAPLGAHSIGQFVTALAQIMAAPLPWLWLGLLLHVPLFLWLLRCLRDRKTIDNITWIMIALAAWVGLQMLSLAYGRAVGVTSSRYLDIVVVIWLLDYVAIRRLSLRLPRYGNLLTACWLGLFALGMGHVAVYYFDAVADRWRQGTAQARNVSNYMMSGDIADISNKPSLHVPYPDAARLAMLLSDRTVRMIVPDELLPPGERTRERDTHLISKGRFTKVVRRIRDNLLFRAPLLVAAGFSICLIVSLWRRNRSKPSN